MNAGQLKEQLIGIPDDAILVVKERNGLVAHAVVDFTKVELIRGLNGILNEAPPGSRPDATALVFSIR